GLARRSHHENPATVILCSRPSPALLPQSGPCPVATGRPERSAQGSRAQARFHFWPNRSPPRKSLARRRRKQGIGGGGGSWPSLDEAKSIAGWQVESRRQF